MQTKYKDLAAEGKISIGQCLDVIRKAIANSKRGFIMFGNAFLYNDDEGVTKLCHNFKGNKEVELYSEDGYDTLEDIAHWADIVEDFNACMADGNELYNSLWNINKE